MASASASTCNMLWQMLKSCNFSLSVFFLAFNFAYHTNKAPYHKSLRQARIQWPWHLWLISLLKLLNRIQRYLTGSKISKSSTKFVSFGPSENKMAALSSAWLRHFPLLLWNHLRNSTIPDKKQDLKILYQVCVSRADRKKKLIRWPPCWLRHFPLLGNRTTEFNETWQEARYQSPLQSLCFSDQSEKQDGRPGL